MTTTHRIAVLFLTLAPVACQQTARTSVASGGAGSALLRSPTGMSHGTLRLSRTGGGVRVAGTLIGLPPGTHGIHFHQVGRCDPPDFASAGAHLNPTGALHGLENPLGPHAGDLPNLAVNAAGEAVVDLTTARVTLDEERQRGLFAGDGTALVIHGNVDDQRTDPSGNSGDRIACGVVQRG
jgi:Cu-Zn family superoxide dismutase